MAPSAASCAGGKESTIDYIEVSQGLSASVQDVARAREIDTKGFLHW